jgi:micrococcal nuclease
VAIAAKVTRIVDGDTIHVQMPDGAPEKVRFIGVDSPEPTTENGTYGEKATEFTENALSGKTVYLETDVELRDKYDRLLAHIWLEMPDAVNDAEIRDHLFNAHLLLAGYANLLTIPPDVKYVDYLQGYESEARAASLGLWAPPPVVATPELTTEKPTAAAYIANKNTRKFHYASCGSVNQMNESNKVPYSSRDAAVADGYVPCKNCRP